MRSAEQTRQARQGRQTPQARQGRQGVAAPGARPAVLQGVQPSSPPAISGTSRWSLDHSGPQLEIGTLQITLPASASNAAGSSSAVATHHDARALAREVAEAVLDSWTPAPGSGDLELKQLVVPPVEMAAGASSRELARGVAAAVLKALAEAQGGRR
ncbi:MAG: hypothetical protein AAGD01_10855 [Acidobacteriota bacterium]